MRSPFEPLTLKSGGAGESLCFSSAESAASTGDGADEKIEMPASNHFGERLA